jgi:hypothetical protein
VEWSSKYAVRRQSLAGDLHETVARMFSGGDFDHVAPLVTIGLACSVCMVLPFRCCSGQIDLLRPDRIPRMHVRGFLSVSRRMLRGTVV